VFNFIFKKIGEIDFEIGNKMLIALRRRILERRKKDMVSLKRFLQSSSISRIDNYDEFCCSNKSAIVSKSKKIMQNVYYGVQSSANSNTSSAELCPVATDDVTFLKDLQNAISAVPVVQTLTSKTKKEIEIWT
jgi:hypothetical protein